MENLYWFPGFVVFDFLVFGLLVVLEILVDLALGLFLTSAGGNWPTDND